MACAGRHHEKVLAPAPGVLSILCWLWQEPGPRKFLPQHVNVLQQMFVRTLTVPHRFICVADSADGFSSEVEVVITPPAALEAGQLRSPEGPRFPSCYRRLWAFSEEARQVFGERVFLTDIDIVLIRDIGPLIERDEDFVGWRPIARWGKRNDRIGGGMYLLRTGSRTRVWTDFKGQKSIAVARAHGFRGSDQAWISHCLGRNPVWPQNCGLYSIRDLHDGRDPLPADARLVQFNGTTKPWDSRIEWVRQHWQSYESRSTPASRELRTS